MSKNLHEEIKRMQHLVNFKIGDNSHDVLSEQNIKKSVIVEQADEVVTDDPGEIDKLTTSTGYQDVVKGIAGVTYDEKSWNKEPSELTDLFLNNYIILDDTKFNEWVSTSIFPDLNRLIKDKYSGTLRFKINSGASKVNATNKWDDTKANHAPNHNFGNNTDFPESGWIKNSNVGKDSKGKFIKCSGDVTENCYVVITDGNPWLAKNRGQNVINKLNTILKNKYGDDFKFEFVKGDKFGEITDDGKKYVSVEMGGDFIGGKPNPFKDINGELVINSRPGSWGSKTPGSLGITWESKNANNAPISVGYTIPNEYFSNAAPFDGYSIWRGQGSSWNNTMAIKNVVPTDLTTSQMETSMGGILKHMGFKISVDDIASALGGGLGWIAKGDFNNPMTKGEKDDRGAVCCKKDVYDYQDIMKTPCEWCIQTLPKGFEADGTISFSKLLTGLRSVYGDKVPATVDDVINSLKGITDDNNVPVYQLI